MEVEVHVLATRIELDLAGDKFSDARAFGSRRWQPTGATDSLELHDDELCTTFDGGGGSNFKDCLKYKNIDFHETTFRYLKLLTYIDHLQRYFVILQCIVSIANTSEFVD